MHILITDSGVGGLSVCAYAERFLRTHTVGEPVRLTYVNASPENEFGYNSMGSRSEKIENFNRFLDIISAAYAPDLICIACNTLSVLFPDTQFSKISDIAVQGIVETGVNRILHELYHRPRSIVAIFGTVTTIEEHTYSDLLRQRRIDENRIIPQACPSLADTISEDRRGLSVQKKIDELVDSAIAKSKIKTTEYLVCLACTHYGYRKDFFATAFEDREIDVRVLNPNEFIVKDMVKKLQLKYTKIEDENDVKLEFITRYKIPKTTLETITFFLEEISPKTIQAFTNYTHTPTLF